MISENQANLSPNIAADASPSPLANRAIFNFTGDVAFTIIGKVITQIQNQATTVKLSVVSDALASFDICTTKDINNFLVGTQLSIDGTPGDPMIGTTGVGTAKRQALQVVATCITSGQITVTFGAASTGAIEWEIQWVPLNAQGNVTPA
jgi:hypothetical protein